MMDRDQVLEKTKKELRSLLISAPRGVALPLLAKDYKMVIGREMPYRELGFRNVEQFIDSIPDTVQLGSGPAGLTCYAIANAETRQIARFVASQKKPSIKKSMIPPAAVIRKPVNMAGFTKKSRFGPANSRKTGGGGGARYVPAGYPPRGGGGMSKYGKPLYSKSAAHAPTNLAPRMSARSSVPTFETGSRNKSGISPVRYPSQGMANAGPAHMPRPQSTSSLPSQTRVVTSTAKPSVRYPGPSGQDRVPTRSISVYPWKKELESCDQVSIVHLNNHKTIKKLVCTSGYIVNKAISDSTTLGLCYKRLLFTEYHRPSGLGKGLAVLLVFKQPRNVEGHEFTRSVHDMAEGTRLKVYGMSFVNVNKKKNNKKEAGVDVYFYERVDDSSSNGRSSTPSSHGSPNSARSISPPLQATSTSQMSANALRALDTDILTLLKDHPGGVYGKRLGKQYETNFKKTPPPDVLAYALKLPFVRSEELAESFVVLYLDESKAAPATMATTKSAASAPTTPVSTSVKFITDKPALPGTVELGVADEVVNVEVVFIESVVSFYVQRIGEEFSDKFQAMEKSMSSYLSRNAFSPLTNLCEENLYALRWNEEGSSGDEVWCRVLIRSILREQKKAYVLCPDFGNSLIVKMSDLKDLPREFYELPFQAVHCCLDGLHGKDFIDEEKALDAFERLALNKVCIAQVMENSGARVSVELIDSESDGQETINSLLLQDLCSEAKLTPTLPEPGAEKVAVKFTDIDMDGTATVQLLGPGLNQLEHLMNNINQTYKRPRAAHFVSKVEVGMLCCALFSADGKWYRAVVKEIVSSKQILVEFVDYGNEEAVERAKLRKKLDHHLFNLPYQAVKCTLHGLPPPNCQWTEAALDFAMQYLETDNIYLQVVEKREGSLPSVKLLISDLDEGRDGEGELLDLNDMLLSERQLFESALNLSDGSDTEAVFATPTSSSTPEKPVDSQENVPTSPSRENNLTKEQTDVVPNENREEDLALTASNGAIHPRKSEGEEPIIIDQVNSDEGIPSIPPVNLEVQVHVHKEGSEEVSVSPEQKNDTTAKTGNGQASPSLELDSEKPTSTVGGEDAEMVEPQSDSQELLKLENSYDAHQLLTPPSSGDNLSVFSPHTPSGSPSHLSSTPPQTPPKVVHSESSSSLSSAAAPFSPHTPLSSPPSVGGTPVHFGAAHAVLSKVYDIKSIKRGLNFVSLEPKSTVAVIVSWAASPSKFTVQLVNNLGDLDNMSNSLTQSMNNEIASGFSLSVDQILPGLICCASVDEQWLRVLVLEPPVSPSSFDVKVEYLDYGGTDRVAISCLRQLPDTFRHLPFQGISSSLCNVTPAGGSWSPEALQHFEKLYHHKQLFAVVHSKNMENTSYNVHLVDTSSVPGQTLNLRKELEKHGFAI